MGEPTENTQAVPKSYADNIANIANSAKATADFALPKSGGTMTGTINMNGQPISGLNDPTEESQVARKGYVDTTAVSVTIPASGWVGSGPYTQTVTVAALTDGRRCMVYPAYGDDTAANLAMLEACACLSYAKRDRQNVIFTCLEDKPAVDISVTVEVYV